MTIDEVRQAFDAVILQIERDPATLAKANMFSVACGFPDVIPSGGIIGTMGGLGKLATPEMNAAGDRAMRAQMAFLDLNQGKKHTVRYHDHLLREPFDFRGHTRKHPSAS